MKSLSRDNGIKLSQAFSLIARDPPRRAFGSMSRLARAAGHSDWLSAFRLPFGEPGLVLPCGDWKDIPARHAGSSAVSSSMGLRRIR